MSKPTEKTSLHRIDIVLLLLLILIGTGITLWIYLPSVKEGEQLEIRQNGSLLMTLPLNEDTEQTITDKDGDSNTFYIINKTVKMTEANCGDKTCINTGSISRTGESIVCLPHRLVLQITSGQSEENTDLPDAVVR